MLNRQTLPRRVSAMLLVMVSAAALAACQPKTASLDSGTDSMATGSVTPANFKKAAALAAAYKANPDDASKGLAYANALGSIGQTDEQLAVLSQLSAAHPDDVQLNTVYGKKLVGAGRGGEAVGVLEDIASKPSADWRLHSALGSAYDQNGQFDKARAEYNTALAQKPDALSVLNNLGMSYALEGNLKTAESTLRKALAMPGSRKEPRIRQNLALVVGLQGRFDEARQIASEDLPPDEVEANMAYLQKMLSQSNTWQQLSANSPN